MDFVDDINFLMPFDRHKFYRFPQGADIFNTAVGGGIDFDDIQGFSAHDMETGFTGIAGVSRRSVNTVHSPGKDFGRTRLTGPARARKEIGMSNLVRLYRFLQCLRNMGLADNIFKSLRPPLTV